MDENKESKKTVRHALPYAAVRFEEQNAAQFSTSQTTESSQQVVEDGCDEDTCNTKNRESEDGAENEKCGSGARHSQNSGVAEDNQIHQGEEADTRRKRHASSRSESESPIKIKKRQRHSSASSVPGTSILEHLPGQASLTVSPGGRELQGVVVSITERDRSSRRPDRNEAFCTASTTEQLDANTSTTSTTHMAHSEANSGMPVSTASQSSSTSASARVAGFENINVSGLLEQFREFGKKLQGSSFSKRDSQNPPSTSLPSDESREVVETQVEPPTVQSESGTEVTTQNANTEEADSPAETLRPDSRGRPEAPEQQVSCTQPDPETAEHSQLLTLMSQGASHETSVEKNAVSTPENPCSASSRWTNLSSHHQKLRNVREQGMLWLRLYSSLMKEEDANNALEHLLKWRLSSFERIYSRYSPIIQEILQNNQRASQAPLSSVADTGSAVNEMPPPRPPPLTPSPAQAQPHQTQRYQIRNPATPPVQRHHQHAVRPGNQTVAQQQQLQSPGIPSGQLSHQSPLAHQQSTPSYPSAQPGLSGQCCQQMPAQVHHRNPSSNLSFQHMSPSGWHPNQGSTASFQHIPGPGHLPSHGNTGANMQFMRCPTPMQQASVLSTTQPNTVGYRSQQPQNPVHSYRTPAAVPQPAGGGSVSGFFRVPVSTQNTSVYPGYASSRRNYSTTNSERCTRVRQHVPAAVYQRTVIPPSSITSPGPTANGSSPFVLTAAAAAPPTSNNFVSPSVHSTPSPQSIPPSVHRTPSPQSVPPRVHSAPSSPQSLSQHPHLGAILSMSVMSSVSTKSPVVSSAAVTSSQSVQPRTDAVIYGCPSNVQPIVIAPRDDMPPTPAGQPVADVEADVAMVSAAQEAETATGHPVAAGTTTTAPPTTNVPSTAAIANEALDNLVSVQITFQKAF